MFIAYAAIFSALFNLVGIASTLTMHLIQDFDFKAENAYYYYAFWAIGWTVANSLVTCFAKNLRAFIILGFFIQIVSLILMGPSHLLSFEMRLVTVFVIKIIGLFLLGFSSALVESLGNIYLMNKTKKWA